MQRKTSFIVIGTLFLLLFALGACGTTGEPTESNEANVERDSQTEDVRGEDGTTANSEADETVINDLGIYVGQADPHTVEIETNDGPKAFQLTDESAEQIKALQRDDKVKFQYIINDKEQNILQSIEKMQGTNGNPETGIYNGQQDPHTIEIETENGPTAFQLSNEARELVAKLEEEKKVSYTYRVEGPQLIIDFIEQID